MNIDKELGNFGPDWLVEGKCRQVTNHYLEKLSKELRDDLKGRMTSPRKADMVEFLSGDGEIIWNSFVADLTSSSDSRDYTPFSAQESEALNSKINLAFGVPTLGGDQGDENPDQAAIPKGPSSGRGARLVTAAVLLIVGFGLIIFTFLFLPQVTRSFQAITSEFSESDVNQQLLAVSEQLNDPAFANLSSQIQQLETNFRQVENSLGSFSDFATQIGQSQELSRATSEDLTQQASALSGLLQRIDVVLQQYEAPSDPTLGPGFEVTLRDLVDKTQAMSTPETLLSDIDAAALTLENSESVAVGLVRDLASAWDRDSRNPGSTILSATENSAINAIRDFSSESEATDPLEGLRDVATQLASQPTVFAVPEGFDTSVRALGDQFESLKTSIVSLTDQSAKVAEVSAALQAALQAQSDNQSLTELSQRSAELFGTVRLASAVISQSKETYENTAAVLEDLESGAASLRSLADLQADLAFRGASPAVVLLLAIGGMFVTFGLTSLLKWVKDAEAVRTEEAWQRQARMYSILAGGLLERGIDPTPFLGRLQSISINSEGERTTMKTPVSETVTEIARALQSTLRKT